MNKKSLISLSIIFILFITPLLGGNTYAQAEEISTSLPIYNINAPELDEAVYQDKFFDDSQVFETPNDETRIKLTADSVATHLTERFPNYTWDQPSSIDDYEYVSNTYYGNPSEISEGDTFIKTAEEQALITRQFTGCGPIALCSQFFYLSEHAGYNKLNEVKVDRYNITNYNNDIEINRVNLATNVLEKVDVITLDTPFMEELGINPNLGTFSFPNEIIKTANEILAEYGYDKQIDVFGDILPSTNSFETKKTNIIDSIHRGMPVICWTWFTKDDEGTDPFEGHFMNIYGYEYWQGVDSDNNIKEHLMFIVNRNFGETEPLYMDSEYLDALNSGFIFFVEKNERMLIRPNEFAFPCSYNNNAQTSTLVNKTGECNILRLRTGYVNHFDSTNTIIDGQYLVMSANKDGAGYAYLELSFDKSVKYISVELSLWGTKEGFINSTDYVKIWLSTSSFQIIESSNLLSDLPTNIRNPNITEWECPSDVIEVRFCVYDAVPVSNRNKGRVVIGDVEIIFNE